MADKPSSQVRSNGGYNTPSNVGISSTGNSSGSSSGSKAVSSVQAGTRSAIGKALGSK